jgi:nicotinate-nucleotide pyrophosphorylase (carboxylating)
LLEKEAVRIGGAINHRFGLYDMIMLKDNHIDFCGGIETAIERAYAYVQTQKPGLKIEVETRTIADVKKVVSAGRGKVFRIMLDNFQPEQIKEAIAIIKNDAAGMGFETEASGGINMDNIEEYAKAGVDYVSIGALVHQAKSLDLSLKAIIQ